MIGQRNGRQRIVTMLLTSGTPPVTAAIRIHGVVGGGVGVVVGGGGSSGRFVGDDGLLTVDVMGTTGGIGRTTGGFLAFTEP